jgi:hopanoid biosynthesis associated protein HpnK
MSADPQSRQAPGKTRFLIICADDFGLSPAINEAVRRGSSGGALTAASLMVGAPWAHEAVQIAQQLPQLRVGLHVVLADGHSVLSRQQIPDLVDDAGYFRNGMLTDSVRFYSHPRVREQLAAEIRAQFDAFARSGLPLDHVNAHKHFQLHPGVLTMITSIGRDYGAFAVRVPEEPLWFARWAGGMSSLAGSVCLLPWLGLMRKRLRSRGLLCNDQVFGIACTGRLDEQVMLAILDRLPPGTTEIYLHPAAGVEQPITPSMAHYRHMDELAALMSPRVAAAIAATGAAAGGYSDLKQSRVAPFPQASHLSPRSRHRE